MKHKVEQVSAGREGAGVPSGGKPMEPNPMADAYTQAFLAAKNDPAKRDALLRERAATQAILAAKSDPDKARAMMAAKAAGKDGRDPVGYCKDVLGIDPEELDRQAGDAMDPAGLGE